MAQQSDATFDYSPRRAAPGESIEIVGKCLRGGSAAGVQLLVVLDQSDGSFLHEQEFAPTPDGSIRGTFIIPAFAPRDDYFLYGSCYADGKRFFRHTGLFDVALPTDVRSQVKGKTLNRSNDVIAVLRVLVVLAAVGSALLVAYGEWTRRHPGGNHHHDWA